MEDCQLAGDVLVGVFGIRAGSRDEVESSCALSVQTKVLRKGLRDAQFQAQLREVADGPCVPRKVTRSEALVGSVKEGEVMSLTDHSSNQFPLLLGRVDTGRVVGAGVEDDDGAGGGLAQRRDHAIEVQTLGLRGKVRVGGHGQANVGEDLVVVGPSRIGDVDGGSRLDGVESRQEEAAQVHSTGARNRLHSGNLAGVLLSVT